MVASNSIIVVCGKHPCDRTPVYRSPLFVKRAAFACTRERMLRESQWEPRGIVAEFATADDRKRWLQAIATVKARTSRAPARNSTRAHSSSVAPVVRTSSTRTTTASTIRGPERPVPHTSEGTNAPRTFV